MTEEDYQEALTEVRRLWGSPVGTADGHRLDLLLDAVITYEDEHEIIVDYLPGQWYV